MKKETNVQHQIQLDAADHEIMLMRNNVGQCKTDHGTFIKFGVGGPGWPDLIGITPVIITESMIGKKIGVFTGIEVKTESKKTGKKLKPSKDQLKAIGLIRNRGGLSGVAYSFEDVKKIINNYLENVSAEKDTDE